MYKSSKLHANADVLSRLPISDHSSDPPIPPETVLLLDQISKSLITVSHIRLWTGRDSILSKVFHFVMYGWPSQVDLYTPIIPKIMLAYSPQPYL